MYQYDGSIACTMHSCNQMFLPGPVFLQNMDVNFVDETSNSTYLCCIIITFLDTEPIVHVTLLKFASVSELEHLRLSVPKPHDHQENLPLSPLKSGRDSTGGWLLGLACSGANLG